METTMKVAVLSKKLRARLGVLKKERTKLLAEYDKKFEAWKRDVAKWLREVPADRVASVKKGELRDGRWNRADLPARVFAGQPKPPTYPSDEAIEKIHKTLRYVAVTGQQTIRVSPHDVEEWFGKGDNDG